MMPFVTCFFNQRQRLFFVVIFFLCMKLSECVNSVHCYSLIVYLLQFVLMLCDFCAGREIHNRFDTVIIAIGLVEIKVFYLLVYAYFF